LPGEGAARIAGIIADLADVVSHRTACLRRWPIAAE